MAILDRTSLAERLNNKVVLDPDNYSDAYIDGVIADVTDDIAGYLNWNPVLSVHTNETGVAQFIQGGTFGGRYMIELRHQPLVPGEAPDIFTSLSLTYPLTVPMGTQVALNFVKVIPDTGQVFCLAPGSVEALSAVTFGSAPLMQTITAVGYSASYSAGYSCGASDPTNPITNQAFVGVPPLPGRIREAALLLVRERLSYDAVMNANPQNPNAGVAYRIRVGEREQVYRPIAGKGTGALGMGTPLALAAEAKIAQYKKRRLPYFV